MQQAGVDLVVTATIIRETIGVAAEMKKAGMTNVKDADRDARAASTSSRCSARMPSRASMASEPGIH